MNHAQESLASESGIPQKVLLTFFSALLRERLTLCPHSGARVTQRKQKASALQGWGSYIFDV